MLERTGTYESVLSSATTPLCTSSSPRYGSGSALSCASGASMLHAFQKQKPAGLLPNDAASSNDLGCSTLKSTDDENASSNGKEMPRQKWKRHGLPSKSRTRTAIDTPRREHPKCEHGRRKGACRQCGGKAICKHKRIQRQCIECAGGATCIHKRRKRDCKDCGGTGVCIHGKSKYKCKDCGGRGICAHRRQKDKCKECGGSGICSHGLQKGQCRTCERARAVSSNKVAAELEGFMGNA
jgi:hypothetical protein